MNGASGRTRTCNLLIRSHHSTFGPKWTNAESRGPTGVCFTSRLAGSGPKRPHLALRISKQYQIPVANGGLFELKRSSIGERQLGKRSILGRGPERVPGSQSLDTPGQAKQSHSSETRIASEFDQTRTMWDSSLGLGGNIIDRSVETQDEGSSQSYGGGQVAFVA
jgi:hypothetical protein